uniref:IS21 family transposase n=1 Tax=Candidatus Electrothrix sp. TaxID=2170559 RepID=UPI004055C35E
MKNQSLDNSIVCLHTLGWSVRRLAGEFKISRERVDRILRDNRDTRQKESDNKPMGEKTASKLDNYKEYIGEILDKYKDDPPTIVRVLELVREKGYDGGRTILSDYLATVRVRKTPDPITCVETSPGKRGSHDWSEYYIYFSETGQKEKVIFFSFILNYSRRQYIEIVEDQKQLTLFKCLINTFIYFDGVPRQVKGDNQKACVDRWEYGRPVFNKTFLELATHYRFTPLTITPGKPRENLKIERPFYFLEKNFLNARSFFNRDDLKKQLLDWLLMINDQRIHRTTGKAPIELYREEFASLLPLPKTHFDTTLTGHRIVNNEACVEWDRYFYAVPPQYMYETCLVRESNNEIFIYSPTHEMIKNYPVAEKGRKDKYIGRRPQASVKTPVNPPIKDVIQRLEAMGSVMTQYIEEVKKHRPVSFRHHLRKVLSLKVNYHSDDIIMAVRRGLKHKVYRASEIENFLEVNAQKKNELNLFGNNNRRG